MSGYPTARAKVGMFAVRFLTHALRRGVCNDFGADAIALLTLVATTEDRVRYAKAPRFWWENLTDVLGLRRERLSTILKKLVAAGWLHYEPGGKSRMSILWVMSPEGDTSLETAPLGGDFQDASGGNAVPETEPHPDRMRNSKRTASGTASGPETELHPERILIPTPIPQPLKENAHPAGLFDPIPDRAFDESPDRLVEESAFVTRWNQLEAAAGRGLRGLSADRSRSFWLIRGDPELWEKCQEAMAKMRSGLQNGAKISLQKFLTEETILEIIGGKHDFTPGKSRGSVGLNAVSAAQSQSGGSEEEIGGPQVDL